MRHKERAVPLVVIALTLAVGAVIFLFGAGGDGLRALAGVPAPTPTAKPGTDASLSGVYDALVHPADKSVGLHHCIMRVDHDAGDDRVKAAAVCYIDTPGLNPGSDLPERADMLPGPPPPPPYTTSAPTKLDGSYDSGTDTLTLAGCWTNIGGTLGPNAILEITLPSAKASLPDLEGSVVITGQQSVAACDTATPKGPAPDADSLNLTRATASRDFDSDGCTDADELSKPGPSAKCGDDPYNPHDSDDDVTGTGNLLITVERADVCQGGGSTQSPDPCAGANETPEGGTGDDLADGTVVGGSYYHCITDTSGPNADLAVRIFCYTDNPVTTVNCQDAAGNWPGPCSLAESTCDPAVAGAQEARFCGDGLPGSGPPGGFRTQGDVDDPHTQLSGMYDKGTNQLSVAGCFQNMENALEGPSIYWELAVDGQTGQGMVDIHLRQDPADCKAGSPDATPDGLGERFISAAGVEMVEQPDDWDTDGDNCSDAMELSGRGSSGGLRDPYNRWDWFDQWINGKTDGSIVVGDIGVHVARFGTVGAPGDPKVPPTGQYNYHTQADRGGRIVGSAGAWNLKPPDGSIVVGDGGAQVAQFGHAGCGSKNP